MNQPGTSDLEAIQAWMASMEQNTIIDPDQHYSNNTAASGNAGTKKVINR